MKVQVRIGLAVAVVAAAAAACRFAAAEEAVQTAAVHPEQADAEMVAKGNALYARYCAHCHGLNMVNPGTIAYDLRRFPHDDKTRFVNAVTNGKNGRMPQWGDLLNLDDIDELWAYVKTGGTP
jgi:cytochrome c55X